MDMRSNLKMLKRRGLILGRLNEALRANRSNLAEVM
jgi:hypothetical protein